MKIIQDILRRAGDCQPPPAENLTVRPAEVRRVLCPCRATIESRTCPLPPLRVLLARRLVGLVGEWSRGDRTVYLRDVRGVLVNADYSRQDFEAVVNHLAGSRAGVLKLDTQSNRVALVLVNGTEGAGNAK